MPPHPNMPDTREFRFLRGELATPLCWESLLFLSGVACVLAGIVLYLMYVNTRYRHWLKVAQEKRAGDEGDSVFLELEAGRRYNIPVEHLRNMEIRVTH
jgi:hypothetical protein